MLPLEFSDKRAALAGAFLNRFAIGFVIGAARLPLPGWAAGLVFGLLLSLPDAIITKAYAPILFLGASGGAGIGYIVGRWGAGGGKS
jgi:membrane protein DedA with SNARE-associated domain